MAYGPNDFFTLGDKTPELCNLKHTFFLINKRPMSSHSSLNSDFTRVNVGLGPL